MKHLIKFNESNTEQVKRYKSTNKYEFKITPKYEILYKLNSLYLLINDNMLFIGNSSIENYLVVGDPVAHLIEINNNFEEGYLTIEKFIKYVKEYSFIVDLFYEWGELSIDDIKKSNEYQTYLKKEKSNKFNL